MSGRKDKPEDLEKKPQKRSVFKAFRVWCGRCRSLRKRLIIVFRAKSEAVAELCPVVIRVKSVE